MKKLKAPLLWNIVIVMTILVYIAGLFIPIMEPDAAVYAQVSMEMYDRSDLLSIYHKGNDWLDKPHFPFWMSAFSYKIFGVNIFAYKLPAVIFIFIAAAYTFLFARRFYSTLHAWISVLLLMTAQHIIISNNDVRAEPFLTGLVIMGLYHLAMMLEPATNKGRKNLHMIAGSLALACLIMTKGLFTIIPVAAGVGLSLLYARNLGAIFSWRWIAVIVCTAIFLSPALYGYYLQFDLHPEKTVFGQKNVSGVEFFLWTSQWGRFTNTGPITGKGDFSYFVHTMMWAFLPWAFMAFFALFNKTRRLLTRRSTGENYTYFGFAALFLIFSVSKFQLSFYLNPLFPLLSILTTAILLDQGKKVLKVFSVMHLVLCILLVLALAALNYFFGGGVPHVDTLIVAITGLAAGFYLFAAGRNYLKKIFFATALVCLSVNYYLSREFYPGLLKYQAESEVAYYMKASGIDAKQVVFVGNVQSVADIILHHTTPIVAIDTVVRDDVSGKYVFTSPEGRLKLDSLGMTYHVLKVFDDFHVTMITGKFINKKTREQELQKKYLLRVAGVDTKKPERDVSKLIDRDRHVRTVSERRIKH